MEPAWRQQGRGRGRGQEAPGGERSRPPQKERPGAAAGRGGRTKPAAAPAPGVSVQAKFEQIRKSNQAAAQRLVESRLSSSSDEDDEDDDDDVEVNHRDGKRGKILASTFTTYTDQTGEPRVTMETALGRASSLC